MGAHLMARRRGRQAALGRGGLHRKRGSLPGHTRRRAAIDLAWIGACITCVAMTVVAVPPVRTTLGPAGAAAVAATVIVAGAVAAFLSWRRLGDATRMERELAVRAGRDPLTGLANRSLLCERLGSGLGRGYTPAATRPAVLFCDLDRFKRVNDTYGHAVGDELLKAVAERLTGALRRGDLLGRLGGDELVAVCQVVSPSEAAKVAERLLRAFDEPFVIDGADLRMSASIGVAVADGTITEPDGLLRSADRAMYVAKAEGGARAIVFQASMGDYGGGLGAAERLRQAIARDELRIAYQPVVSLADGRMVGVEALVRWDHPERGVIATDELLALLDECGLSVTVGTWTLEEACRQARRWREHNSHTDPLRVTINVGARQLADAGFRTTIGRALASGGARPSQLQLEVTESDLMLDPAGAWARLRDVKAMGVDLCLDAFGTGYSSLSFVRRFSVDALKIDRSFVAGLTLNAEDRAIVAAIVGIANGLGLQCVAEGVETGEQLSALTALGCTYVQGDYVAPAMTADTIDALLANSVSVA